MVKPNRAILCSLFVLGFLFNSFCTITISTSPATVGCADTFTTDIVGTNYQWSFGDNAFPHFSSDVSPSAPAWFLTAGSHTINVTVTTGGGPVTDAITVNVQPGSGSVALNTSSSTICKLKSYNFTATPSYPIYAFFVNDSLRQSSSSNSFSYLFGFGDDSIRVFGLNGSCFTNASPTIYANDPPSPATLSSSGDTICGGEFITFTAQPTSYDSFFFYVGSSLLASQTSNVWTTNTVYNMNAVSVYVAKNGCHSAYPSNYDTIVVKATPQVTIVASDSAICQGTPVTITASYSQSAVDSFNFFINSVVQQTGLPNTFISSTFANNDTVTATGMLNGCESRPSPPIIMAVDLMPVLTLSADAVNDTSCPGVPVTFTANPGGYSNYEFFNQGVSVQNGTDSTYVTSALGNGNGIYVIGTNIGCPGLPSDTVSVFILPPTIANAGADTTLCQTSPPDTITGFSPTGGTWSGLGITDPTGIFTPSTAGAGVHPVVYTYTDPSTGCPGHDTAIYTVNQPPTITVSPNNPSICENQKVRLTASGGSIYQWSPLLGLNDSTIANPDASPAQTTTYTVIGADNSGCANSATVTVTVNPAPTAGFTFNQACARQATQFTNTSTPSTGTTYSWRFGDGTSSALQDPVHNYAFTDSFHVMLIAQNGGCNDTISQPVFVFPAAVAAFDATPLYSYNDDNSPVHFNNTTTGAETYNWDFGDQLGSTEVSPSHVYRTPGVYSVTLVASNQFGCDDSITRENYITIYQKPRIYVPNAFSPNGDNVNDILHAYTQGAKFMDFKIFDQIGELVYFSNNVDGENATEGWDGKYRGKAAPMGVYTYSIKITFEDNTAHSYEGSITLIR